MKKKILSFFGIPVNALTGEELSKELEELLEKFRKDQQPRYATSINAYFLSYLHGWIINHERNPELLRFMRRSDLTTIDSKGLATISKLLDDPIETTISGEDLLKATAEVLNRKKLSVYLLGGRESVLTQAKEKLKGSYPHLKIAGTSCPLIFTKGGRLEESQERDQYIVEEINQSSPDVLFLQLGHPKQEIWFERIHHLLKVPLTVGIGGAFEHYIAEEPLVPEWAVNLKAEKAYKEILKPLFSILKHAGDFLKYACWLIPLLAFNLLNQGIAKICTWIAKTPVQRQYFFLSSNKSITVIPFPSFFADEASNTVVSWIEEAVEEDYIVLDFSELRHINLKGIGMLMEAVKWAEGLGKKLFIIRINSDVRFLLKLQGVWNYFEPLVCNDANEVLMRMAPAGRGPLNYLELYESIYQEHNEVVISFFGDLSLSNQQVEMLEKLKPILGNKRCLLDFTYCTSIDNLGIGFLLKLRKLQQQNGTSFKLTGLSRDVKRQLIIARVYSLFDIA